MLGHTVLYIKPIWNGVSASFEFYGYLSAVVQTYYMLGWRVSLMQKFLLVI